MKIKIYVLCVFFTFALQASVPAGILKPGAPFGSGSLARDVVMQPDGKFVVCGYTTVSAVTYFTVARFTSTGALDTTFNAAGTYPGVVQETGFGSTGNQQALALVITTSGKIIVVGQTDSWTVIQYTNDGSRDISFGLNGLLQEGDSESYASAIALDPENGNIFVVGNIGSHQVTKKYNPVNGATEATSTGSAAPAINTVNSNILTGIIVNAAGVWIGYENIINAELLLMDTDLNFINNYNDAGSFSESGLGMVTRGGTDSVGALNQYFVGQGVVVDISLFPFIFSVASRPTGSLGSMYTSGGDLIISSSTSDTAYLFSSACTQTREPLIVKINYDLSVSNSFGSTDGVVNTSGSVIETTLGDGFYSAVALQNNEKIIAVGWSTEFEWTMARYNSDGSRDITFDGINYTGVFQDTLSPFNTGANGFIYTTTIDQSGKIVVGGQYNSGALSVRYTNTAGRDGTFGNNGVAALTALATTATIQKIINSGAGYLATGVSNSTQVTTLSLTSTGGLNSAFNSSGYVVETGVGASAGYDLLLNGTALAVAGVTQTNSPSVINYNSSTGSRDSSFQNNGYQQFPKLGTGSINAIAAEGISRYGAGRGTNNDTAFVKLLVNGTGVLQDTTSPFNTSLVGLILTTTIDQFGKIVVGGFYGNNATAVRYTTTAGRDGDFGSNGVTVLTSLAPTSSINKIINATGNGYLATGASATGGQIATVSLTSTGTLNTIFNGTGYVQETTIPGPSGAFDLLLNGTALSVAGVTQTNIPSVLNYNSLTGIRNSTLGVNGYQNYSSLGIGSIFSIISSDGKRYAAGQTANAGFVKILPSGGILKDTLPPFNTGANGLLYTTTIDQSGKILVGGQYGGLWEVVSYLPTAARNTAFGGSGNGVAVYPSFDTGGRVRSLALDSTGKIIATGASQDGLNDVFTTVRYNSTGSSSSYIQESLFGVGSGLGLDVYADNSFAVPGFTTTGTNATPTIISYNADLTRNTYNQYTNLVPGYFYRIADIDGNHYAAGSSVDTAIVYSLINNTGLLLDTAAPFNTGHNGIMYGGMIDSSGNIVLCGNYNDIFTVVSYLNTGTRNIAFNSNGVVQDSALNVANGYAITQDSAGNYYVAASSTVGGNLTFTVVKYTNAGVLDATFGNGGVIQETSLGIGKATAIIINGNTIFVGGQTTANGTLLPTLIAYTTDGQRIATFGTNGVQTYPNFGEGILNNVTVVNISVIASAGQMGDVATIVQIGQSNILVDQINNGF